MKKVLIVSTVGVIYDGITSVILSNLKMMNVSGLKFYIVGTIKIEPEIKSEFEEIGIDVIEMPNRKINTIKYIFSLIKYIKQHKIDIVHIHGNSATMIIELLSALIGGCKKRIVHSHNTKCDHIRADRCLRPLFDVLYTDALACGKDAGIWLFKKKSFTIINNGRDIDKYSYNKNARNYIRKKYNIGNELVVGHVGGFYEQKNHRFLIDIFRKIQEKVPLAKFFLIGDGPLREEVMKLSSGINAYYTGAVNDVETYLSAMDGMIFPSLFEGLPLVVVEWQINGLPMIISDFITDECIFTDFVKKMPLCEDPDLWAKEFLNIYSKSDRSQNAFVASKNSKTSGFDIKESSEILRELYLA